MAPSPPRTRATAPGTLADEVGPGAVANEVDHHAPAAANMHGRLDRRSPGARALPGYATVAEADMHGRASWRPSRARSRALPDANANAHDGNLRWDGRNAVRRATCKRDRDGERNQRGHFVASAREWTGAH